MTLDLNRGVRDALFNLSRDSFGTFGVFLCVIFGLEHVAYGTTFQGASIVSVSSASYVGTLIWMRSSEKSALGINFNRKT